MSDVPARSPMNTALSASLYTDSMIPLPHPSVWRTRARSPLHTSSYPLLFSDGDEVVITVNNEERFRWSRHTGTTVDDIWYFCRGNRHAPWAAMSPYSVAIFFRHMATYLQSLMGELANGTEWARSVFPTWVFRGRPSATHTLT